MSVKDYQVESKLDDYLRSRGLKKMWLAEQLGVSNSQVTAWCKDGTSPHFVHLFRMVRVLDCSLFDLYDVKKKEE